MLAKVGASFNWWSKSYIFTNIGVIWKRIVIIKDLKEENIDQIEGNYIFAEPKNYSRSQSF